MDNPQAHTPGEWMVNDALDTVFVKNSEGQVMMSVPVFMFPQAGATHAQQLASVYLIASAPLLQKALIKLILHCESELAKQPPSSTWYQVLDEANDAILRSGKLI